MDILGAELRTEKLKAKQWWQWRWYSRNKVS